MHLGLSYGCARLSLLFGAAGAGLHAAFQHGVAQDEVRPGSGLGAGAGAGLGSAELNPNPPARTASPRTKRAAPPSPPSPLVTTDPLPPPPPAQIIDALDTLAGSWCHLARVQRACLVALLGGAACELLLWVQRDGWCWLLLLFGARAVARRARGQLAAYQCAAALAACTDVLALASTTDGPCVVLRWLTLLSKLASVGLLAFYPTAFS